MKPIIRCPKWRLELAREHVEEVSGDISQLEFDKGTDPALKRLTQYLCKDKDDKVTGRILRKEFPYIHEACMLNSQRKSKYSDVWILEALVTAGLSNEQVSEYLGFGDPKFVQTFCLCFYDLRDKYIKQRYIKNIRALCESDANVNIVDYGWKYVASKYGFEIFERIILETPDTTDEDLAILDREQMIDQKVGSWWISKKRRMLIDSENRPENATIVEKYIVDADKENAKLRKADSGGESVEELTEVMSLMDGHLEVLQPGPSEDPKEKRLTKKARKDNGKNVKKQ